MWFETLTGFQEESPEQVRNNLLIADDTITSTVNGKSYKYGSLETPTLAELRKRVSENQFSNGKISLKEVVGDVQQLHTNVTNSCALFQVASQFNLLEMISPSITPENGVGIYEIDITQGPACAIAAGAGTIYRNYYVGVNNQIGQTFDNQINCLYDLGKALGNTNEQLWMMRNGYALATKSGLVEISERLKSVIESERDALRQTLRVGIQWNTQVTLHDCKHTVNQVYCSALPVAYSSHSSDLWADFAQLVLEASYEATLYAALLNLSNTGHNKVFLTLLGGGAFGNQEDWILAAIKRSLLKFSKSELEVVIVNYKYSNSRVRNLITSLS